MKQLKLKFFESLKKTNQIDDIFDARRMFNENFVCVYF